MLLLKTHGQSKTFSQESEPSIISIISVILNNGARELRDEGVSFFNNGKWKLTVSLTLINGN